MTESKERKILVAINYDNCYIEEALKILGEYIDVEHINTHNVDESKNYIDLRHLDDDTWNTIVYGCVGENKRTYSGLFLVKYDDWRLCSLPVGWWD